MSKSKNFPLISPHKIPTLNRFIRLRRPNPIFSSSTLFVPLFPLGFKDNILIGIKFAHERKLAKRKSKKISPQHRKSDPHIPSHPLKKTHTFNPPSSPTNSSTTPISITAEDTIKLANELGITVDSLISELHNSVISILKRQKSAWMDDKAKE